MCVTQQRPASVAGALDAISAGLAFLNALDAADLATRVQADCLKALARAESAHTAAQASMLAAFSAQGGCEDDGQHTARAWLKWQARITAGAAAGQVGWAKRLARHPAVGAALAAGEISPSWARDLCGWTDLLPGGERPAADDILLAAAAGGATHADLASLADEMRRRCAGPDEDAGDGFDDRSVRLDVTFGGAGRLSGDLTPACTAALSAVLDALGKAAGREDVRTADQRRHDALEEACRRLIGAQCLPDRAGQPTQVQLHMTLDELRGSPGGPAAEAAWAARAEWSAEAYACDAAITPLVAGHVDRGALAAMTAAFLGGDPDAPCPFPGCTGPGCTGPGCTGPGCAGPGCAGAGDGQVFRPLGPAVFARIQDLLLRHATGMLSGPAGLAAFLRTELTGAQFPAASLPLDTGAATEQVPAHLRRAVIARDRHCAFPGCEQPPAACQVHHVRPRSRGGPTCLANLTLLCSFHHLIAVHRWGWALTLHPDGTVTAVSPDGSRTLRSHGPPGPAQRD